MAELAYHRVYSQLTAQIKAGQYPDYRLPDERSLTDQFGVSRSTIKRALGILVSRGIVFQKQGAGTFVNPLYFKSKPLFNYTGDNIGITDSLVQDGQQQSIQVLHFHVQKAKDEIAQSLFLQPNDFVYRIERLRLVDGQPFMIEIGYLPIRLVPDLNEEVIQDSLYTYLEKEQHLQVTKSFLNISTEPSTASDQKLLQLKPNEPVGVMEGIFFTDSGTPIEFSRMRIHYKYMQYNSFVSLS
ncbi:GntR family transcriptional regulator [Schleiferilactobacillus perolens]|jgi:DNA-binding GntR family transcriptional regulator|uniref:GntR family transcriptional regulator n=1 Tax=Schleiferilactobacillus perolens DSM 12744 TaxID=1423792 RepID=A0A0R1N118_9LACO|nr:GntR family transcriptional regulator [Schleiferilactobacillus perolens]KRL13975.1 GntR family transcriptional regulator [Schleiferilactobacillus perolens DSM 12744]MCI2171139.1 GntR family transcriptional regulator [Schleiferilactobacillus perolens]